MSLQGKTALITGGGRGIGRAIAERLAEAQVRIVVTGRTRVEIDEVASKLGGVAIESDLANRESRAACIQRIVDEIGVVDILVNNAGIAESAPFDRTSTEVWDRTMEVNVTAPFDLCRALVPKMIEKRWGRVINMASNAGRAGYPYTAAYCASKHALVGLTRALAAEIARSGVTVNAVCPGWVDTQMSDQAASRIADKTGRSQVDARSALTNMSPQRRLIETSEVAHLVLSLCAHEARGIHGQAIVVDGGQVMA